MIDWILIDQTIAQIGFFSTIISQFILIFLTLFIVKRDFGAYKYLIILFSVVGIAFASCEYLLYPVLHSHNAGYMFFTTNRPLAATNTVLTVMLAVYTGLYSSTISLLAVQFIYRYFAVFNAKRLKYFKGFFFGFWVLYSVWFGFEWGIGLFVFNYVDDYSRDYMKQEMKTVYGNDISNVPCVIHVVYKNIQNSTDYFVRWKNVMCTFNMSFIMIVQYGIMIYCGCQLYFEMDEKISMCSSPMKKLHRQIFKTLVLQITTPTLVLFSPIVFVIFVQYFDLELSVPTGVFLSGFTLYPALDACIIISSKIPIAEQEQKHFLIVKSKFP